MIFKAKMCEIYSVYKLTWKAILFISLGKIATKYVNNWY